MNLKIKPTVKEEILGKSVKLDSELWQKLSNEDLKKVSGGIVYQEVGDCPCCGGKGTKYYYEDNYGAWAIYCIVCDEIFETGGEFTEKCY